MALPQAARQRSAHDRHGRAAPVRPWRPARAGRAGCRAGSGHRARHPRGGACRARRRYRAGAPGEQGAAAGTVTESAAAGTLAAPRGAPGPPRAAPRSRRSASCAATEVPAEHGHVADLEQSTLSCACRACYLLFTHPQAGRGRYRAVPDRYLRDPARQLTVAEWDEFEIPVGLAFFLRSSQRGRGQRVLPEPGRRHREHAQPAGLGPADRGASAARRRRSGRRGDPDLPDGRRRRVLPGADRRLLRAGRPDAAALARVRRRRRGPAEHRRVPRPGPVPLAGVRAGA